MKKILFSILLFTLANNVSSQATQTILISRNDDIDVKKDSKYLQFEEWPEMSGVSIKGVEFSAPSSNYYILENKIIFKDDDDLRQLFPSQVEYVDINNVRYKPITYTKAGAIKIGFFNVLTDGKHKLIKQITFTVPSKRNSMMTQVELEKLSERKIKYYYLTDVREMKKLPRGKKSLAKIFSKRSKATLSFIKNNKLKLRNENDLIKIFDFNNTNS